jgi:broad specificity phosphatase PhoE
MTKSLVLIRHGQRDMDIDDRDNGLNVRGLEQARALANFFRARFPDGRDGVAVRSSPRRRCVETAAPLAAAAGAEARVDPNLDEQQRGETSAVFERRVQDFLRDAARDPARLTIAFSHGDWLPRAIHVLTGHQPDLPNACWYEVEWRGGVAELTWFIPTFEPFRTRS